MAMTEIQVNQRVQLIHDIPELGLHRVDAGIVCSTWFSPVTTYEVEFQKKVPDHAIRTLLMPNQIKGDPERY